MERRLRTVERFWRIRVVGSELFLHVGPHGTPGQRSQIPCRSPEVARTTADALVAQRLRDGFAPDDGSTDSLIEQLTPRLLAEDLDAWAVLGDALLDAGDEVRGGWVGHQLRAARRVRGAIGQSKAWLKTHEPTLWGEPLHDYRSQVSLDWFAGFARAAEVWSGLRLEPVADVLPHLFTSPATRFLRALALGPLGDALRLDETLEALVRREWPKHLSRLSVGGLIRGRSVAPAADSLEALQPVAPRLSALRVQAQLTGFGRHLELPALESLWVWTHRLEGQLVDDLARTPFPKLKTLMLRAHDERQVTLATLVAMLLERLHESPLATLGLLGMSDALQILARLGEGNLHRLEVLDLTGSVTQRQAPALARLRAALPHVKVVTTGGWPPARFGVGFD